MGWTTRFAPAPTGRLHLGHVADAIWVWGAARASGGRVLLRIEDHDRVRSRPEHERALLEDLAWLGFEPDAPPVRQSDRTGLYRGALEQLAREPGRVYVCDCSRRRILEGSERTGGELRYPGTCRSRGLAADASPMRRIRFEREEIRFTDGLGGEQVQVATEQCGDLLARDRDSNWTYQFAVVVDDLEQGIDVVIRGDDLLASTGRQIQLARLLGRGEGPRFLHHPLVLKPGGAKLSKSDRDTGVHEMRNAGWGPERTLGAAAAAVGLLRRERALGVGDLAELVGGALKDARWER